MHVPAIQRRLLVTTLTVALVAGLVMVMSLPGDATTPRGDAGKVCFSAGKQIKIVDVGDPEVGFNIIKSTLGFATVNGNPGRGTYLKYMKLKSAADRVVLGFNKPVARKVCVSWRLEEGEGP
jgi:hypothetical protein